MSIYNSNNKTWLIDTKTNGTFNINYSDIINYPEMDFSLVDNTPTDEAIENLTYIINNIYEPCCQHFTSIIKILPSYRNYQMSLYLDLDNDSDSSNGSILYLDINSLKIRGMEINDLITFIKNNIEFNHLYIDRNANTMSISVYNTAKYPDKTNIKMLTYIN